MAERLLPAQVQLGLVARHRERQRATVKVYRDRTTIS